MKGRNFFVKWEGIMLLMRPKSVCYTICDAG